MLIVLDQLEELVTRTPVGEQQAFLRRLDAALTDDSPLWVVATLRSEFLSTAPDRAGLAEVIDDSLFLEALSRARLPEIIERPAQQAGVDFAPGLVGQIVEEISSGRDGSDALPLLAYALRELYERTGRAATITTEDYAAIGGVVGALQRRADRLLDELTRHGRAAAVLPALMKLAAVEGESEPVRRRLPLSAFSGDEVGVIEAFVEARLLTTRRLPQDEATVEVAHEALLRQWTPLRDAIESSRSSLRMRSELERLAAAWVGGERDESYLLRGTRLAGYDAWAREHLDDLGPVRTRVHRCQQGARIKGARGRTAIEPAAASAGGRSRGPSDPHTRGGRGSAAEKRGSPLPGTHRAGAPAALLRPTGWSRTSPTPRSSSGWRA